MTRLLYLDCFSGASGDMLLGALVDAGLPFDALVGALGSLALEEVDLSMERVLRAGVSATKVIVRDRHAAHAADPVGGSAHHTGPPAGREHQHQRPVHEHHHHHVQAHAHEHVGTVVSQPPGHGHGHRTLHEIEVLIGRSALGAAAQARAVGLFRRLAEAEAAIHGIGVDQVHLHEVGAVDSIVDIVGGVFGLEWFGADEIVASPLNTGHGRVRCAHGVFPVPAPATARLVAGVPVYAEGPPAELLTPTGALLVTGHATGYGPLPPMRIERIGYGAGDRDFAERPNVLRVLVGTRESQAAAAGTERVVVMECEIDDMNPQLYGALMERLQQSGALDVYYAPVHMKKNRLGTLVTVVAPPDLRETLTDLVFRETTTLGLRFHEVQRECLQRELVPIETPYGAVRVKIARRGGAIVNVAPEFDDCRRCADEHGVPLKDVQMQALRSYLDRAEPD